MNSKVLILGSTGLIGKELTQLCANNENISQIILPVRRLSGNYDNSKIKEIVVDFDKLENYAVELTCDAVFCCLGTTIKKAGSKAEFRKPDYEYPLSAAKLALATGAKEYHLVSAMGANPDSKVFYSKVKGEVENAIKSLNYETFNVYRPSLLLGDREEKRSGEIIFAKISKALPALFSGPLSKYAPIYAKSVAQAMLNAHISNLKGFNVFESQQIENMSK